MRVEVDARVRVAPRYLERAQREAARVLAPTLALDWSAAGATPAVVVHLVSCEDPDEEAPPCRTGVVGSTVPGADGASRTVWIYMDRLHRYVTPGTRERVRLFGRVLAHEIVHAVVGHDAHEFGGLMRPFWSPETLWHASDEEIELSPALRARIRTALAAPQVATSQRH